MTQNIAVVVGAQFGSEGKGHVTAQLVKSAIKDNASMVINVRVAGPNAGHTVIDDEGNRFALRSVPVGAAISDEVFLYIAPGSEVELDVLEKEILELRALGHACESIAVSGEATLLEDKHKRTEGEAHLTDKVGSTGKGIGAARADRLMRSALRIKDSREALDRLARLGVDIVEPVQLYANDNIGEILDQTIVIEGTQGYGLGLHAGHYPQCTSSDARAIDFLGMAGLSPWNRNVGQFTVWVVARAFPIRVAGNSGELKGETSWQDLGLPEEHTTVTQKVRRVGEWDGELLRDAVQANGGAQHVRIALTMADQRIAGLAGFDGSEKDLQDYPAQVVEDLSSWITEVVGEAKAHVGAVTTSPTDICWVRTQVVPA